MTLKLRKHLVCFGQRDLGGNMPIPFPLGLGILDRVFP